MGAVEGSGRDGVGAATSGRRGSEDAASSSSALVAAAAAVAAAEGDAAERAAAEEEALRRRRRTIGEDLFLAVRRESQCITQAEAGLYRSNPVDPWLEKRLVQTLEPIK
jgi:hypothetical protein